MSAPRLHLVLMMLLTFSTGIVDAVGFLGLDQVFAGNMTGNVVILGMALAGAQELPVLGPALALGGFMTGASVAGRALRRAAGAWTTGTTILSTTSAAVTLGVGILVLVGPGEPGFAVRATATLLLGAAMGLQAALARVVGVRDVTTVVVTSTITGLAADSRVGSGKASATAGASARRSWVVALMVAGAATGALLLRWDLAAGLLTAGAVALVVATLGGLHHGLAPRQQPPAQWAAR